MDARSISVSGGPETNLPLVAFIMSPIFISSF
jgi:hypothetical protein